MVPDTLLCYEMEEIAADVKGRIDFDSDAFKADNYLELVPTMD